MGVMHLSLASNVNLADSLLYASKSIDDENIRKHFLQIHELVLQGNNCSDSIDALPKYLHTKIQDWMSVISSGEKTGFLKEVFQISHTHVQENLLEAIDRFQKIIEPVLIIFVGVMVLSICLSIILPMYQLTQSLQ
jgi:type II secretory pathway component PulF